MILHPSTWWLIFLLPIALVAGVRFLRRRRATMGFSSLAAVDHAPSGRCARWIVILPFLRFFAIACIVIALARPVIPAESAKTLVEGVAIELVMDRSDSMRALDFTVNGTQANRLDALKDLATKFVTGGDSFAGRSNDLIGVVTFARYADSVVPLTLDQDVVADAITQISFPEGGDEMGTAIGDALALGVDKLKDAAERANRDGRTRITSKVVLLFTDGESNAGDLAPEEAAALAKATGVKVYCIGLGTIGVAPVPQRTPFGTRIVQVPVTIDEDTLRAIATETGGEYFRATDTKSLREIYQTIDQLEKSKIEETRSVRYTDLAVESFDLRVPWLGTIPMPPLLGLAVALLCTEILLAATRMRSLA
jgi:Ca-activated chloride channel family protein